MSVEERVIPTATSRFRSMYREHYGLVWGAARRFGVEDQQLDDAVQETFLAAYRRMGSFGGGSPKAWLYSITRRVASNYRRTAHRTTRRKEALWRITQTRGPRPVEAVEAWQAIDRFVRALPERHREIFVLSELEGMSGAEVARTLGLRPSTTYDAIRALRLRLRNELGAAAKPGQLASLAQRERPKATARSWSALVAAMPYARVAEVATPSIWAKWSALSIASKAGLGTAAVLTVALAASPRSSDTERTTAQASVQPMVEQTRAVAPLPTPTSVTAAQAPRPVPTPTPTSAPNAREPPPAALVDHPRTEPPGAPPAAASIAAENALLRDAAAALAAEDPSRALALADRHVREHPASPMVDMSLAVRVESLCALGKGAQARGEARVFLRRRPDSPVAERIASACPQAGPGGP